jgi:hypothetical protein
MTGAAHPEATFRVHLSRDSTGFAERSIWCVTRDGREMGRFPTAESALRAAMAFARGVIQKGEAAEAAVVRARDDGTEIVIHLGAFR